MKNRIHEQEGGRFLIELRVGDRFGGIFIIYPAIVEVSEKGSQGGKLAGTARFLQALVNGSQVGPDEIGGDHAQFEIGMPGGDEVAGKLAQICRIGSESLLAQVTFVPEIIQKQRLGVIPGQGFHVTGKASFE